MTIAQTQELGETYLDAVVVETSAIVAEDDTAPLAMAALPPPGALVTS
jgi:hypothetical protein